VEGLAKIGPIKFLEERHLVAVGALTSDLKNDKAFQLISEKDACSFLKGYSAIWRTQIRASEKDWTVDIGLPKRFPDEPPIAYVIDWKQLFLQNPHVLNNGLLCTIPGHAALNSEDPIGLFRHVCSQAKEILLGLSADDFKEEFSYYWNQCITEGAQDVLLIDQVEQLGKSFPAAFCNKYICVASSAERLNYWATNLTSKPLDLTVENAGILVCRDTPLLPKDYPNTLKDLISLAESNDSSSAELIKNHILKNYGKGLVLLSQKEGAGLALGGIIFNGLGLSQSGSTELTHGFRRGKVPEDLLFKRASHKISSTMVGRGKVVRAYHSWIHSRGGDGRDLSQKAVLLIGCGSLGGYVAHLVSRAGVGRITVIDNDLFSWENVGRHILGTSSVYRLKADALTEKLRQDLPHLKIDGITKSWEDAFDSNPNLFSEHDLVISTVANWRCENALNALARKAQIPPLMLGWLEPYAVAGHCLFISKNGGCFKCQSNEFGQFLYNVAKFRETTISKEPGSCTHYQQYGPTFLMPVASMIASAAIDMLLASSSDSCLTTWISSEEHFKSLDASIADVWVQEIGSGGYSRIFRKLWKKSDSCNLCSLVSI